MPVCSFFSTSPRPSSYALARNSPWNLITNLLAFIKSKDFILHSMVSLNFNIVSCWYEWILIKSPYSVDILPSTPTSFFSFFMILVHLVFKTYVGRIYIMHTERKGLSTVDFFPLLI